MHVSGFCKAGRPVIYSCLVSYDGMSPVPCIKFLADAPSTLEGLAAGITLSVTLWWIVVQELASNKVFEDNKDHMIQTFEMVSNVRPAVTYVLLPTVTEAVASFNVP